jgi:hypothetical protein
MADAEAQDVKFLPGIRQDVDRLFAPPGTLIDAQNVRYSVSTGISGRNGTRAIAAQSEDSGPSAIAGKSVVAVDRTPGYGVVATVERVVSTTTSLGRIFSYDTTRARWGSKGLHGRSVPVRARGGIDANGAAQNYGSSRYGIAANTAGYVMYVGSNSAGGGGARIQIQDGGGALLSSDVLASITKVACIAVGTRFVIVSQIGTALSARDVDVPSTGLTSFGSPYAVGTLTSAASYWDICPDATAANWYLVFQNAAATIRADRFAAGATVSNANNTTACTGTVPISAFHNTTGLWIGYYDNPGVTGAVTYRVAQSNLSGFVAAAVVILTSLLSGVPLIGPPATTPETAAFVCRGSLGTLGEPSTLCGGLVASAVSGSQVTIFGAYPISKPTPTWQVWVMTGAAVSGSKYQRAVLVSISPSGSGTRIPELVTGETERAGDSYMFSTVLDARAPVATLPNGNHVFMVPELLQKSTAAASPDAIRLSVYEYEPIAAYKDAVSGQGLVVSGQPVETPGQGAANEAALGGSSSSGGATEVGFVERPYVVSATQAAGGGLTLLSSYSWVFTLEWTDFAGRRHRSAPSAPQTVLLTGGNNAVNMTVTMLQASQKNTLPNISMRLVAYRTLANQPDVFYREAQPTGGVSVDSSISYTYAAGAAAATDAVIATNERVYTDGGVRENKLAPSCRYLCESEDRVWCGGLWDPRIIQASKIIVPGEPLQFTDDFAFQVVIPDEVTGLAYLDGNVIAFCQNAIYLVSGDGPNDQGAGSFTSPRAVSRDLGCIDYRSIVETSFGVLFQSTRGIYLLPRGFGNPVFVGMAVQDIMSAQGSGFSRVLAASVSQDSLNRLVRFLVENPTSSTTRVLVYDLDVAQTDPLNGWSYDTFTSRLSCIGSWPSGTFMALYDIPNVLAAGYLDETAATFLTDASNTQNITSAVQTADLRYAGLAGQWRCGPVVGVMSTPTTGATVTITVSVDDLTPDAQSWALTTATGAIYRQVTPAQPQCSAVNVRFSCARTAVRGPNFHGLTLELQPQPGARRTNSAER